MFFDKKSFKRLYYYRFIITEFQYDCSIQVSLFIVKNISRFLTYYIFKRFEFFKKNNVYCSNQKLFKKILSFFNLLKKMIKKLFKYFLSVYPIN